MALSVLIELGNYALLTHSLTHSLS